MADNTQPVPIFYTLLQTPDSETKGRALSLRLLSLKPDPRTPLTLKITTNKVELLDTIERTRFMDSVDMAANLAWMLCRNQTTTFPKAYTLFLQRGEQLSMDGASAGLIFVLASVINLCPERLPRRWHAIAASGILANGSGEINAVKGIQSKLEALLDALGPNAKQNTENETAIFLPKANQEEWPSLPGELKQRIENDSRLSVYWVSHVCDALSILAPGHFPERDHLVNNPFKGLQSFDFDDQWSYFGREPEIAYVVREYQNLLHTAKHDHTKKQVIAIRGTSGSGKSSFVKAGLLPAMINYYAEQNIAYGWSVFRPGTSRQSVTHSLALALFSIKAVWSEDWKSWLRENYFDAPHLAQELATEPTGVIHKILHHLDNLVNTDGKRCKLALVVDQLEEALNHPAATNPEDNAELHTDNTPLLDFYDSLLQLAAPGSPVDLFLTVREDYIHEFKYQPFKRCLVSNGNGVLLELGQVSSAGIEQIIRKPFSTIGYEFEEIEQDQTVASLLIDDAKKLNETENVLPYLELKLSNLYESTNNGVVAKNSYNTGSLADSIGDQADQALRSMPKSPNAVLYKLFYLLIGYRDIDSKLYSRQLPLEQIKHDKVALSIVEHLESARIIIRHSDPTGQIYFQFAHETILTRWDLIRRWIRNHDTLETINILNDIERNYQKWKSNQCSNAYLLDKGTLKQARDLINSTQWLDHELVAYVQLSNKQNRFLSTIIKAGAAVLIVATGLSFYFYLSAYQSEQQLQLANNLHERADSLVKTNPIKSFKLLIKSLDVKHTAGAAASLLSLISQHALPIEVSPNPRPDALVMSFDDSNLQLIVDRNRIQTVDAGTLKRKTDFTLPQLPNKKVDRSQASSDGNLLLIKYMNDDRYFLVNLKTKRLVTVLDGKSDQIKRVTFSLDSRYVYTISFNGVLTKWTTEGGTQILRRQLFDSKTDKYFIVELAAAKDSVLIGKSTYSHSKFKYNIHIYSTLDNYTTGTLFSDHSTMTLFASWGNNSRYIYPVNNGKQIISVGEREILLWDLGTRIPKTLYTAAPATDNSNYSTERIIGSFYLRSRNILVTYSYTRKTKTLKTIVYHVGQQYLYTFDRLVAKPEYRHFTMDAGGKWWTDSPDSNTLYKWPVSDPHLRLSLSVHNDTCNNGFFNRISQSSNQRYLAAMVYHKPKNVPFIRKNTDYWEQHHSPIDKPIIDTFTSLIRRSRVCIWDIQSQSISELPQPLRKRYRGYSKNAKLVISNDGNILVFTKLLNRGEILIYNRATKEQRELTLPGGRVSAAVVTISPSSRYAYAVLKNNKIFRINLSTYDTTELVSKSSFGTNFRAYRFRMTHLSDTEFVTIKGRFVIKWRIVDGKTVQKIHQAPIDEATHPTNHKKVSIRLTTLVRGTILMTPTKAIISNHDGIHEIRLTDFRSTYIPIKVKNINQSLGDCRHKFVHNDRYFTICYEKNKLAELMLWNPRNGKVYMKIRAPRITKVHRRIKVFSAARYGKLYIPGRKAFIVFPIDVKTLLDGIKTRKIATPYYSLENIRVSY